ncbi:Ead domain protein [Klebsiella pneumoniae]|nr:Ead domain protein [Klebsiella pneumoniae]
MTTDITELAQNLKAAANTTADAIDRLKAFPGDELIDLSQHKGEQVDIDITTLNEWYELSSPANVLALVEALEKAQTINAAAEKLVRCKGRYHSELNYRALAALFGVTTPDLPPLDSKSGTVTVKQFDEFQICHYGATEDYAKGYIDCQNNFFKWLNTAGIKWEAE